MPPNSNRNIHHHPSNFLDVTNVGLTATSSSSGSSTTRRHDLRLVTYNVHAWRDSDHCDNFDEIVQAIKDLKPDILCLNEVLHPFGKPTLSSLSSPRKEEEDAAAAAIAEAAVEGYYRAIKERHQPVPIIDQDLFVPKNVNDTYLYRLAYETHMDVSSIEFCGATSEEAFGIGIPFGNAFLVSSSKFNSMNGNIKIRIDDVKHVVLTPQEGDLHLGNQKRNQVENRAFSAYQLSISSRDEDDYHNVSSSPTLKMTIALTHLDHKSEELRALQMERGIHHCHSILDDDRIPHFIVGDMNTFQKSDCSTEMWNDILNMYSTNGWPSPPERSLVLDYLKKNDYKDTFYNTIKKTKEEEHEDQGQAQKYPSPTGWTKNPLMRIDHVFMKNNGNKLSRREQASSGTTSIEIRRHFCADKYHGSDHFPVVVDFTLIKKMKDSTTPTRSRSMVLRGDDDDSEPFMM